MRWRPSLRLSPELLGRARQNRREAAHVGARAVLDNQGDQGPEFVVVDVALRVPAPFGFAVGVVDSLGTLRRIGLRMGGAI